jgi:hypothetical protein
LNKKNDYQALKTIQDQDFYYLAEVGPDTVTSQGKPLSVRTSKGYEIKLSLPRNLKKNLSKKLSITNENIQNKNNRQNNDNPKEMDLYDAILKSNQ